MLEEYRSTNYGVVNPRTLEHLYEVIYNQQLNQDIARRTGSQPSTPNAVINFRPYTSLVEVEVVQSERVSQLTSSRFRIVSQHAITRQIAERCYDIVICATGYHRSSWINLLKQSNLGKRFGLDPTATTIRLLPALNLTNGRVGEVPPSDNNMPSPLTSSSVSTPPTSPSHSFSHLISVSNDLYVSRNYELLRLSDETASPKNSRVYIQGVEEMTHGLSDTLLSVVGIRAGEVVADILREH